MSLQATGAGPRPLLTLVESSAGGAPPNLRWATLDEVAMGGQPSYGSALAGAVLATATSAMIVTGRRHRSKPMPRIITLAQKGRSHGTARHVLSVETPRNAAQDSSEAQRDRSYLHLMQEPERAKLAMLRERLPAIASDVDVALRIWGIDMTQSGDAADIVLLKFLRAADLDVDQAAARLAATARYRAEQDIDAWVASELPEHYQGHDFLCPSDANGRPIMISRYGAMDNDKVFGDVDAFVRYRMHVMERAMRLLSFRPGAAEDLCQIHDYSGVSLLFKTSEVKKAIAAMTKVFGDHYPETKGNTIFVNFPPLFAKLFQTFAAFIPERTRNKFLILGENDQAMLFEHVKPEQVPEVLGGMLREQRGLVTGPCKLVPVKARSEAEADVLQVDTPALIGWELRVCAQEAAYQVVFVSKDGQESIVDESGDGKYIQAADGIVTGEWRADGPGTLKCRFRNGKAWLSERLCVCRAAVLASTSGNVSP